MRTAGVLCWLFLALSATEAKTRPSPEALEAFESYTQVTAAATEKAPASQAFLNIEAETLAHIRAGEILVSERVRSANAPPSAMIQDWEGLVFVPGVTLDRFRAFLQDYDNYKKYYAPAVIESRLKRLTGDHFEVFLRLYKQSLLTVVLNVDYRIQYSFPSAKRMAVVSRSTRVAQVKDPQHPDSGEYPVENDDGLLWRLNTYWRVEEADGGVYAQCEAVSLSRDAPLGLGFILKGFLAHFPRESMIDTLRQTRQALQR